MQRRNTRRGEGKDVEKSVIRNPQSVIRNPLIR